MKAAVASDSPTVTRRSPEARRRASPSTTSPRSTTALLPNFVVFGRPLPEGRFAAVAINLLNSSAESSVPVEAMGFGPGATLVVGVRVLRAASVGAGLERVFATGPPCA